MQLYQYALRPLVVVAVGSTHRVVPYEFGLVANLHIVVPVELLCNIIIYSSSTQ